MKTDHWVEWSQRFYLRLLRLYPQAYRATYELEMFHVFTDQCREVYKQRGRLGIFWLWLRTFADLTVTVPREHFLDPQARLGLLEAQPNAPLPWKGVLLVLIPGLIFFISQIVQLTSTKDWFFLAFYRAAYFLILPVLIVWLLSRRFPVWGLIPLGLLYGVLRSYNPSYVIDKLRRLNLPHSVIFFKTTFSFGYLIAVSVCVALLCGFIVYYAHHRQIHQSAWRWLGLCGLLILFQIGGEIYRFMKWQNQTGLAGWSSAELKQYLFEIPFWYLYEALPFLVLVFIGLLFSRKYGGFSFLLLLGYLLPTIIFGRYGEWTDTLPFYLVSTAVFLYRFIVALVAPIWLVRAASMSDRQRAAVIPVVIAIVCHILLNLVAILVSTIQNSYQLSLLDFALNVWNQVIIAAGVGLAVALYLPGNRPATQPPVLVSATE